MRLGLHTQTLRVSSLPLGFPSASALAAGGLTSRNETHGVPNVVAGSHITEMAHPALSTDLLVRQQESVGPVLVSIR